MRIIEFLRFGRSAFRAFLGFVVYCFDVVLIVLVYPFFFLTWGRGIRTLDFEVELDVVLSLVYPFLVSVYCCCFCIFCCRSLVNSFLGCLSDFDVVFLFSMFNVMPFTWLFSNVVSLMPSVYLWLLFSRSMLIFLSFLANGFFVGRRFSVHFVFWSLSFPISMSFKQLNSFSFLVTVVSSLNVVLH